MVHKNGELEKYWSAIEKKNSSARRAAIKLEKMKKRLEMGSDYEDSGNEMGGVMASSSVPAGH